MNIYHILPEKGQQHNSISVLVDAVIEQAISARASDIHLEPSASLLRVRFRLDGMLFDQTSFQSEIALQIVSRIKICAGLDIAQRRLPQDGKFRFTHSGGSVDLRVSTFPTLYGEKIVIRILDRSMHLLALGDLGLQADMLADFKALLKRPQGFIIVTGPTGSGKTTSLYAALNYLHTPEKNIITLEDPVEYEVLGITQGQIQADAGFTFAKGMRALLRQDPDIAMIGEMRDTETAAIAIEAALTGHLVLSTLHTNDSISAIVRLLEMGVPSFLINAALSGVVAQRLVRKICLHCKEEYIPEGHELIPDSALTKAYRGSGCQDCSYLGYKGRIGIFELLVVSDRVRQVVIEGSSLADMKRSIQQNPLYSLYNQGLRLVQEGITSIEEFMRVVVLS